MPKQNETNMATQNTIIQLLNEAGYKNQGTNRERAIKNLNLLLDAGILQLKFVHADKYNNRDENWGFWYKSNDGKQRCTAYKLTIFGKTYYGHFIAKRDKSVVWGIESINYLDNSSLDISAIMLRVAKMISILKKGYNFMQESVFAKYGDCSCSKCRGIGIIPQFMHYAEGICFDCGGSGIDRHTLKMHISEAVKLATK